MRRQQSLWGRNDDFAIKFIRLMKKLNQTLPSTKPDHLYSSQPSQSSFLIRRQPAYQTQLQTLLAALKTTRHLRYYLLPRDWQEVYSANQPLLQDLLGLSQQELWKSLAGSKQQLNEQGQIALLLKILLEMNKRKHEQADAGNIGNFDEYRAAIEWFIPQIVAYEQQLRQKIEAKLLETCEEERKKREGELARYQNRVNQHFEQMEMVRKENLASRLQRETEMKEVEIREKVQHDMHIIKASKQLQQAKDTVLLRKLAPYRWEKKRPYEDETYRQQLDLTLADDHQRRLRVIDNLKRVEQLKLRKAQTTLVATQEMLAQTHRDRLNIQLANDKAEFHNNQQRAIRNLKHSVDMANNQRVSSLRKSLQAFSQHEDSLRIKEILQDHHYKVQFNSEIDVVSSPQATVHQLPTRYATVENTKLEKTIEKHQRRLEKRVEGLVKEDETVGRDRIGSGRRSLLELYDKSLNLLQ